MADLHILREHALGFAQARKVALHWAEQVEKEFGMECSYEEGKSSDLVTFGFRRHTQTAVRDSPPPFSRTA